MSKVRMELEVEYVRREKIVFVADPDDGFGTNGLPYESGRILREMHCQMHRGKDLVAGEKPRLLSWYPVPRRDGATLECGCWTYAVMPGTREGSHLVCPKHGPTAIEKCNVDEPDELYLAGVKE